MYRPPQRPARPARHCLHLSESTHCPTTENQCLAATIASQSTRSSRVTRASLISPSLTSRSPGRSIYNSKRTYELEPDSTKLSSQKLEPKTLFVAQLGAEFVGTFILIFFATAAPIVNQKYNGAETLLGNAGSAGLAVMIVILSTGHISGAHLNPSLTIAFAVFRHFPWVQVPAYIAAQVSASICASFALKGVFHPFMAGGVTTPSVSIAQAFMLEFIITFNLMFVVTAVATDTRAVGELAGIAVGAAVLLNILIAGPATGGSMNPVRTLGPAVAAGNYKGVWIYLVAPTIGAVTGAAVYTAVKLKEDDVPQPSRPRSFRR